MPRSDAVRHVRASGLGPWLLADHTAVHDMTSIIKMFRRTGPASK